MFERAESWVVWAMNRPGHLDIMDVLLIVGLVWAFIVLLHLHRRMAKFDLTDLLMSEGNVSFYKSAQLGCFLISTWGFVHLTWNDKLTEWYYSTYMFAWAGASLVNKYLTGKAATTPVV